MRLTARPLHQSETAIRSDSRAGIRRKKDMPWAWRRSRRSNRHSAIAGRRSGSQSVAPCCKSTLFRESEHHRFVIAHDRIQTSPQKPERDWAAHFGHLGIVAASGAANSTCLWVVVSDRAKQQHETPLSTWLVTTVSSNKQWVVNLNMIALKCCHISPNFNLDAHGSQVLHDKRIISCFFGIVPDYCTFL